MNENRHTVLEPWESLRILILSAYGLDNTHRQSISFCTPCCAARSNTKIITIILQLQFLDIQYIILWAKERM
jgi:hypothetical protein